MRCDGTARVWIDVEGAPRQPRPCHACTVTITLPRELLEAVRAANEALDRAVRVAGTPTPDASQRLLAKAMLVEAVMRAVQP